MKNKNTILALTTLLLTFGNALANDVQIGESTKALISKEYKQNIKWTGLVLETVVNSDSTCFQIAETATFNAHNSEYTLFKDDSRFIACKEGQLKPKDYNGKILTVLGNVVSFYTSDNNNGDYAIVETNDIKRWRLSSRMSSLWGNNQFSTTPLPKSARPTRNH